MNIENLTLSELRDLNKRVCAAIRHKHTLEGLAVSQTLKIGDNVSFKDRYGFPITGHVSKINLKSIKVNTNRGIWNVSPTLLTKA